MAESVQVAVLGAGPGGYAAAFYAADIGMQVALIDEEEATLKTFRREGQMIRLDPANRSYEAQRYRPDQVRIQGRLAGLIRRY